MSELVPADQIEQLVQARRHPTAHIGRADADDETFYILHSQACKDSGIDLRECDYSVALDLFGIGDDWPGMPPHLLSVTTAGTLVYSLPYPGAMTVPLAEPVPCPCIECRTGTRVLLAFAEATGLTLEPWQLDVIDRLERAAVAGHVDAFPRFATALTLPSRGRR